jgi:hypothetical protein
MMKLMTTAGLQNTDTQQGMRIMQSIRLLAVS